MQLPTQALLAAEQVSQAADVQQQAAGRIAFFQTHERAERLAIHGQLLQGPQISRRVVWQAVHVAEPTAATHQRLGFGKRHADSRTAELRRGRNRSYDLPASRLMTIQDDLRSPKRVVGGHQSLDGPAGKPDAQYAAMAGAWRRIRWFAGGCVHESW